MAKQPQTQVTGDAEPKKERQHRATYSRDNRSGGWLVRVVGPHANKFAKREIPVTRNDNTENMEQLTTLITSGVDEGKVIAADKGKNYALYHFEQKPREDTEAEF